MAEITRRRRIHVFALLLLGFFIGFAILTDRRMLSVVKQKNAIAAKLLLFPEASLIESASMPGSNNSSISNKNTTLHNISRIKDFTALNLGRNKSNVTATTITKDDFLAKGNKMMSKSSVDPPLNATNSTKELQAANETLRIQPETASPTASPVSNTANVSSTASPSAPLQATLAVHLSGEFGNHLCKLARGFGIQQMAQQEFNITIFPLLKQQVRRGRVFSAKARPSQQQIQKCFPYFRQHDFEAGNRYLLNSQEKEYFVKPKGVPTLDGSTRTVQKDLAKLREVLQQSSPVSSSPTIESNHSAARLGYPTPMIEATSMSYRDWFESYYDVFREEIFKFDDQACCSSYQPYSDESVFHHRGFATEMPKVYKKKGYEELSPELIASKLFGHLKPGDKVAVVGRFVAKEVKKGTDNSTETAKPNPTQQIVSALQARGLKVRTVGGGNPMHDFCFLKNAQKELVGMFKSTYVLWAFLLGNMKVARFYAFDSPIMRKSYGDNLEKSTKWKFTHPELKAKYKYEIYKA